MSKLDPQDWLSPAQCAEIAPVSTRTIQEICQDTNPKTGRTAYGPGLPHFRLESPGGRITYKIRRADLQRWIDAHMVGRSAA